jgi:hypothetical protein
VVWAEVRGGNKERGAQLGSADEQPWAAKEGGGDKKTRVKKSKEISRAVDFLQLHARGVTGLI